MPEFIDYDPKLHKGLPLYVITGIKIGKNFGTTVKLVENQYDIDHADECPETFFVKYSDTIKRQATTHEATD
jgi:hypothetical protein